MALDGPEQVRCRGRAGAAGGRALSEVPGSGPPRGFLVGSRMAVLVQAGPCAGAGSAVSAPRVVGRQCWARRNRKSRVNGSRGTGRPSSPGAPSAAITPVGGALDTASGSPWSPGRGQAAVRGKRSDRREGWGRSEAESSAQAPLAHRTARWKLRGEGPWTYLLPGGCGVC